MVCISYLKNKDAGKIYRKSIVSPCGLLKRQVAGIYLGRMVIDRFTTPSNFTHTGPYCLGVSPAAQGGLGKVYVCVD